MPGLTLRFDSDPDDLGWYQRVQEALTAFAATAGFDATVAMLLPSAVVEAINNIIKHAYLNEPGRPITLTAEQDAGGVCIVLRDRGGPMPLPLPSGELPDDAAESGRGWRIIRSVFPDAHYVREGNENVLTLSRAGTADAFETDGGGNGRLNGHPEKHP